MPAVMADLDWSQERCPAEAGPQGDARGAGGFSSRTTICRIRVRDGAVPVFAPSSLLR